MNLGKLLGISLLVAVAAAVSRSSEPAAGPTVAATAIAKPPQAAALTYGPAITLEQARKVVAAAESEARANGWNVVIAIVDSGGHLVMPARMDDAQFGSLGVAQQKAWTAVAFRRPSKAFQDGLAAGGEGLRALKIEGLMPIDGGLPIVQAGRIIGGIGVSGVAPDQDAQIARAGLEALK